MKQSWIRLLQWQWKKCDQIYFRGRFVKAFDVKNVLYIQDGGVVGHEAHLLTQICQKYTSMWNNSQRISTERQQKTSYFKEGKKT